MLHIDRLYEVYPELVCDLLERVHRVDGTPKERLFRRFRRLAKGRVGVKDLLKDAFTAWRSV